MDWRLVSFGVAGSLLLPNGGGIHDEGGAEGEVGGEAPKSSICSGPTMLSRIILGGTMADLRVWRRFMDGIAP